MTSNRETFQCKNTKLNKTSSPYPHISCLLFYRLPKQRVTMAYCVSLISVLYIVLEAMYVQPTKESECCHQANSILPYSVTDIPQCRTCCIVIIIYLVRISLVINLFSFCVDIAFKPVISKFCTICHRRRVKLQPPLQMQ